VYDSVMGEPVRYPYLSLLTSPCLYRVHGALSRDVCVSRLWEGSCILRWASFPNCRLSRVLPERLCLRSSLLPFSAFSLYPISLTFTWRVPESIRSARSRLRHLPNACPAYSTSEQVRSFFGIFLSVAAYNCTYISQVSFIRPCEMAALRLCNSKKLLLGVRALGTFVVGFDT
jgi:hypothetical protein